jgi:autotransporter-associated beta strand protein
MGFDLNNGNNGGGAPVFVSDGASLYFANGNSTMANNVTLSGTGLNGLGALYQENGATATLSGTITLAGDTTFGGSSATGVAKMNGPILGTGALTKVGANLYSLTGSNSYSGPTNINAGTLATAGVNGANLNLGAGNVNVNSGGILRLGYGVTGNNNQNVTTTNNNVTLAGGTIYADDAFQHLAGSLNVTAASIVGATYNSGNNGAAEQDKGLALDVVVSGSGALTIQHTRFDTTHAWDTAFVAFNNNSNTYTGNVTVNENTAANEGGVYLGIGATNALQNSTISISAIPTTGGSGRFGSSPIVFKTGLGSATLGAISGSAPLILTGYDEINHAQGSDAIVLTVGGNGASTSYTGEISGLGSLTKTGAGTFTMNGASTYSGATNVNNGTLTVGNSSGSATGTGLVTVANGATLNGTGSVVGAVTVSGALSGSVGVGGNLTINSLGSMSGSHALAGNVALNNGTVSNVTSDLSLASGKTLSGLGGTVGSVTVASTSTVAPGNSGVGNLTLGGLTTVSGAHLSMDINGTTAGGYDMLTITGSINLLSGGDLTLNLSSFTPGPGSEIIFLVDNTQGIGNTSGAFDNITLNLSGGATGALVSGNGAEGSRININGTVYALTYTANYEGGANFGGNDIALAAVPEPSTWAMMVGGVGMLLSLQRRKRSSH